MEQGNSESSQKCESESINNLHQMWAANSPDNKYLVLNNAIHLSKKSDLPIPICNFSAQILSEETHDDGQSANTVFLIEGVTKVGKVLPSVAVSAEQYGGLNWIQTNWGSRAIIYVGNSYRDHVKNAIQLLSTEPKRAVVFKHTGWRKIDGNYFYLHSGGAIGECGQDDTVRVLLGGGRLANFELPPPPQSASDLCEAIRSSLALLDLAPDRVTFPLFAATFCSILSEVLVIDFSIFLVGPSGSQKSELAAQCQSHFGKKFNRTALPGSWSSTVNANERLAFTLKDSIFVVDDYAPAGSSAEVSRMSGAADRLLRGQGNRSGRDRLTSDAQSKLSFYPRGMIMVTGEDLPRNHSLLARCLVIEMNHGDVNLERLTVAQENSASGKNALAASSFIQWLAPKIEGLAQSLLKEQEKFRTSLEFSGCHARTPDIIATLLTGFNLFLEFIDERGILSQGEVDTLRVRGRAAMTEVGRLQVELNSTEEPAGKFMDLVRSALISGMAYIADAKSGHAPKWSPGQWGWYADAELMSLEQYGSHQPKWKPRGSKIGWLDGQSLYLEMGAAYGVAQAMAKNQGSGALITKNTLIKRLVQKGFAMKGERKKNLKKCTVEGASICALHFPDRSVLVSAGKTGEVGEVGEV